MLREIRARVERLDWEAIAAVLDERGYATMPALLGARECGTLARLFADERRFRTRVDMARHRFGEGEYRYFAAPLPWVVAELRAHLYARLAPIANRWQSALRQAERYPPTLTAYLARCAAAGQLRPTPLLLRYTAGGYNCLHQDLYGALAFPLQVTVALGRVGRDYTGGEFLLVEQRPRAQSRGDAIVLRQGDSILHEQAGGGGFGHPFDRDPAAVAADVRNEKVTLAHARDAYGVVIDPDTLTVDTAATIATRAAAAASTRSTARTDAAASASDAEGGAGWGA